MLQSVFALCFHCPLAIPGDPCRSEYVTLVLWVRINLPVSICLISTFVCMYCVLSCRGTDISRDTVLRKGFKNINKGDTHVFFLTIKPTRCINFSNLFWNEILHFSDSSSVHHQEFFTVRTAMLYVIEVLLTACEQEHSHIYGASILDVSRSHTTTHHSR